MTGAAIWKFAKGMLVTVGAVVLGLVAANYFLIYEVDENNQRAVVDGKTSMGIVKNDSKWALLIDGLVIWIILAVAEKFGLLDD